MIIRYLRKLTTGRLILWCYFIWYLVVLVRYWDSNPRLWGTSLGLSAIVGTALYINAAHSGDRRVRLGLWPTARLFMMPFCVSSFSMLVKDKHFVLIFSPNPWEVAAAAGMCAVLWLVAAASKIIPEFRP